MNEKPPRTKNMPVKTKASWETFIAVGFLVLVTVLTYGVLIPKLGFYRDDWYMIWTGQVKGSAGLIDLFQSDRPFVGLVYAFDYLILGDSPTGWHIYALLIRLMGALAFLWILRMIWPEKKIKTAFIAILFLVYPGFLQQPEAATYKMILLALDAAILSIALTIRALKSKNWLPKLTFSALAIALTLFYLGIFESMIGLEVARILFCGFFLQRQSPANLKTNFGRTFKQTIPYILVALAFLIWRLFIFKSTRPATNVDRLMFSYSTTPWHSILSIVIELVKDVIETTVFAWVVPAYQFTSQGNYWDFLISLLIASVVIVLCLLYLYLSKRQGYLPDGNNHQSDKDLVFISLGAPMVVAALLPIVVAGRNVTFTSQWDRYSVLTSLGVSLFVAGLIFHTLQALPRWIFIFSLIAIGVVTQYHSAAYYRDFWNQERNLWWQMSWRAPGIENNTVMFVVLPRFGFAEDYEIYAPVNMIYNPGSNIAISADVLNSITIPRIIKQEVKGDTDRGNYIRKNYKNSLISTFPTDQSCLHVIDGHAVELPGYLDAQLIYVAEYSRIDRIDIGQQPKIPPLDIFGQEPQHDWCYYYQKIELAGQEGNWAEAGRLGIESLEGGFKPEDRSEWMPVFEAFANTGDLDRAREISGFLKEDENARFFICEQLSRSQSVANPNNYEFIYNTLCVTE